MTLDKVKLKTINNNSLIGDGNINMGNWEAVTVTGATDYATLYVNTALRLCSFKYYRQNYSISATGTITLHSGVIPSTYRPSVAVNCSMLRNDLTGSVGDTGDISLVAWATGTRTINMNAMWHY